MDLAPLPPVGCWRHLDVRAGFEVVFTAPTPPGHRLRGSTTATEGDAAWAVRYDVGVDHAWRTRRATATALAADGERSTVLEVVHGGWAVDGRPRPDLAGCVDVDLESSAVTNALPLRRLDLVPGARHDVPAAFVRTDLTVHRLEQVYTLVEVTGTTVVVDYESATFAVACRLTYDRSGLVLDYPGLAVRHPVAGGAA